MEGEAFGGTIPIDLQVMAMASMSLNEGVQVFLALCGLSRACLRSRSASLPRRPNFSDAAICSVNKGTILTIALRRRL